MARRGRAAPLAALAALALLTAVAADTMAPVPVYFAGAGCTGTGTVLCRGGSISPTKSGGKPMFIKCVRRAPTFRCNGAAQSRSRAALARRARQLAAPWGLAEPQRACVQQLEPACCERRSDAARDAQHAACVVPCVWRRARGKRKRRAAAAVLTAPHVSRACSGVVTQTDAPSLAKLASYGAQAIRTYTAVGGTTVLATAQQYGLLGACQGAGRASARRVVVGFRPALCARQC